MDISSAPEGAVTIGALVAALGVDTLAPMGHLDPTQSARVATGVEFYDPVQPGPGASGTLVLAPLWRALSASQRVEVMAEAERTGAAALVVRHPPEFPQPDLSGPPLLLLNPHISWRQLEGLVEQVLGEDSSSLPLPGGATELLFTIADNVAQVYGGAVSIEDHARNMLAHSTVPGQLIDDHRLEAIINRRVPDVPLNREQYRQVLSTDAVTRFPTIGEYAPRAAIAIRGGRITLGTIWAIDPAGDALACPLAEDKLAALEHAARAAAAHLLSLWHSDVTIRRPEDEALRRVLVGASVGNEGTSLRLYLGEQIRLVGFRLGGPQQSGGAIHMMRASIDRRFRSRSLDARTTVLDDTVYALLADMPIARAADAVRDVVESSRYAVESGIRAGLARSVANLSEVPGARAEADALLRVAARSGERLAYWPDAQPLLLLDALDRLFADSAYLHHPVLDSLTTSGSQADRDLLATILVWLEQRGNVALAARQLSLHENTVRYRVRRFQEMDGVQFDNPDVALAVWAQLRSKQS